MIEKVTKYRSEYSEKLFDTEQEAIEYLVSYGVTQIAHSCIYDNEFDFAAFMGFLSEEDSRYVREKFINKLQAMG